MRFKMFPWLGRNFVAMSWEGSGEGTVAEETRALFGRFAEQLGRLGLGLEHTVRTRLWVHDMECWHIATAERAAILAGKARSTTSSHVQPDRLGAAPRVALDLLAMAAPDDGQAKLLREYDPKTNVLRSLTWGGIVFMSGVTDMTHATLDEQVPVIVKQLSDTLIDAGVSWDKVVRASFMLHRDETVGKLRSLFGAGVAAAIPCVDYRFVGTRQGKRVEVELTARLA